LGPRSSLVKIAVGRLVLAGKISFCLPN